MKKLTLLLGLIILAGCNPKKSSVKSSTTAISAAEVASLTNCNGQSTTGTGVIYDTSGTSMNFNNQVKALLSVNINPNDVGLVSNNPSDQTGVRFTGKIKLDSSGNVVQAQSSVLISVYDSNTVNYGAEVIKVEFVPSRGATITGQINPAGGANSFISLKDNYGEIRFENIQVSANNLSGTVRFQNNTNVTGGSPASGSLGQLFIQRCAFLQ